MNLNLKTDLSATTKNFIQSKKLFFDNNRERIICPGTTNQKYVWKRISSIASFRKRIFPENFDTLNFLEIDFGTNTNKIFLTCVQSLLLQPNGYQLIKRLFLNREVNTNGIYELQFCLNERWTKIVIDDFVPFENVNRSRDFFHYTTPTTAPSDKQSTFGFYGDSIFSHCKDSVWLILLEKAYIAAVQGTKKYISMFNLLTFMSHLTGSINYRVEVSSCLFFSDLVKLRSTFSKVLLLSRMKPNCLLFDDECPFYPLLSTEKSAKTKRQIVQLSNTITIHPDNKILIKDPTSKIGKRDQLNFNVIDSSSHFWDNSSSKKIFVEWNNFQRFFDCLLIFPILFWDCKIFPFWDNSCITIRVKAKSAKVIIQVLQREQNVKPVSFRIMTKKEMIFISEFNQMSEIKTSEIVLRKGFYYLQTQFFDDTNKKTLLRGIIKVFVKRKSARDVIIKKKNESLNPERKISPLILNRTLISLFSFHQTENYNMKEGANWVVLKVVKISAEDRLIALECKGTKDMLLKVKIGIVLAKNQSSLVCVEGNLSNTFSMTDYEKILLCRLISTKRKKPAKFRIVYKFLE